MGAHHFSRHGVERYDQPSGPFKARTRIGNHNAWRDQHAAECDVVAQMDPDHIPTEDFLERTLGYFRDPDVGFVVVAHVSSAPLRPHPAHHPQIARHLWRSGASRS